MKIKKIFVLFLLLTACEKEEYLKAKIYNSQNEVIGTVLMQQEDCGVDFLVDLYALPPGEHGFHIHKYGSCEMSYKDGKVFFAGLAGSHYDPGKTNKHLGPNNKGHKGDLPKLSVAEDGTAQNRFCKDDLTLDEIKNRSLIIHESGDNYQDKPLPLGGGKDRIACGVIED